jgi:conjugative transfer region protein TrbK
MSPGWARAAAVAAAGLALAAMALASLRPGAGAAVRLDAPVAVDAGLAGCGDGGEAALGEASCRAAWAAARARFLRGRP